MKAQCGMAVEVLVLLVTATAFVVAEEARSTTDGNALLRQCTYALRADEEPTPNIGLGGAFSAGLCIGLVQGMLDLNTAYTAYYQATNNTTRPLFCVPVGASIASEQGVRIILRYLQTNPERLHQTGSVLALQALREAFPCPTAPPQPRR